MVWGWTPSLTGRLSRFGRRAKRRRACFRAPYRPRSQWEAVAVYNHERSTHRDEFERCPSSVFSGPKTENSIRNLIKQWAPKIFVGRETDDCDGFDVPSDPQDMSVDETGGCDRFYSRRSHANVDQPLEDSGRACAPSGGRTGSSGGGRRYKQVRFSRAGNFTLGLGVLGALGHRAGQNGSFLNVLSGLTAASRQTPSQVRRSLLHNIEDMLRPVTNVGPPPQLHETAEAREEGEAPETFQQFVKGDSLVLREGDITKDQWSSLSRFLKQCPHVRGLRLQGIDISATEADQLSGALQQIRRITFCDNSIGLNKGSLEVLVAVLLCCGMLESTSIMRNSLNDSHVPVLARLCKHTTLERLSVSWNGITDQGAANLARHLPSASHTLADIDLSYNMIGTSGRSALAYTLSQLRHPVAIHVGHNESLQQFQESPSRPTNHPVWSHLDLPEWFLGTGRPSSSPGAGAKRRMT